MDSSRNFFPGGTLGLISVLLVLLLCCSRLLAQMPEITYRSVSATHLPPTGLAINSMDAASADIDNDGDLDIIIAGEYAANLILINDGSGSFSNQSNSRFPLPRRVHDSEDIAVADFNGDNYPDIVFVAEDDSSNELYFNDGNGFFSDESSRLPVLGISNAVLARDVNNDGAIDILIGNQGQNRILINNGSGDFVDATAGRLPPNLATTQDLEWGDINDDSFPDLIEGNENGNRILINNGSGIFSDETSSRLPMRSSGEETREAELGDVDGDGDPDLFFANVNFGSGFPQLNRLLLNDGSGNFSDVSNAQLPQQFLNTVDGDLVDLDDDGDLDILCAHAFGGDFRVYRNDGNGNFDDATAAYFDLLPLGSGVDVEFRDFNGDGLSDIYLCGFQNVDQFYLAEQATAIASNTTAPDHIYLRQNYPNPFNPSTNVTFGLPRAERVNLTIFDILGRPIRTLLDGVRTGGQHVVQWDGRDHKGDLVAGGLYIYVLKTAHKTISRKMLVMK